MGLISFIKGAGEKIFGSDENEGPELETSVQAEKETTAEAKAAAKAKSEARIAEKIKAIVESKGFEIENLAITYSDHSAVISGKTEKQEDAEKAVLTVGNINVVSEVDNQLEVVTVTPESTYYTVVSGDNLSKISQEVYGNPNKYPVIFEANKPMLSHPDKIYPGQVLRIPPLD